MEKVDLKKTIESYKAKKNAFQIVEVPPLSYLMIDGVNGPDSEEFAQAISTLYPVAYKLKFMSKLDLEKDYVVPPLEALWWADDMSAFTTNYDKSQWLWTAMIMTPEWITHDMVNQAIDATRKKPTTESRLLDALQYRELHEGLSVQTLHVGPFTDEGPILQDMHDAFIPDNGYAMTGKHHEIYFSDFRKAAPEKLRTLLRQPVEAIAESNH